MSNMFGCLAQVGEIISKISTSKFLKFGILISIVNIFGGALGYLYQIMMGRLLEPSEFAKFNAVMSLSVVMGAPLSALVMIVSRKVSALKAQGDLGLIRVFYSQVYRLMFFLVIPAMLIFLLVAQNIQFYLKIETLFPIFIFGGILIFGIFFAINNAFLQGMQYFIYFSSIGLAGIILKAALSGIFIIGLGSGISGALSGVLLSIVIILLVGSVGLLKLLPPVNCDRKVEVTFAIPNFLKKIAPILVANIALISITQLDMVYVNWFFPSSIAGYYAAASILGKAILYLPGGMILVLFPMVSESHFKKESVRHLFLQAVVFTVIACGGISMLYFVYASEIITVFYGVEYAPAADILRWYGFAMIPIALVLVAEQFLIAKGKILFAWLFICIAPVQFFAVSSWHSEIWMVILIMGLSGITLCAIGYGIMLRILINKQVVKDA